MTAHAPGGDPGRPSQRRIPWRALALGSAAVFLADQATKLAVVAALPLNAGRPVIPGFFDLVHVRNTGGAFSLLAGAPSPWRNLLFVALSLLAVGVILHVYRKAGDALLRAGLALVLGGALGNLLDRLRLGEVVDFLALHYGAFHWPAFNVADSAITVGCALLLVSALRPAR